MSYDGKFPAFVSQLIMMLKLRCLTIPWKQMFHVRTHAYDTLCIHITQQRRRKMWILSLFSFHLYQCVYTYKEHCYLGYTYFFHVPPALTSAALLLLSVEFGSYLILLSLWNVRLHKRIICMVGHESAPICMKEIHSLILFVSLFNLQNVCSQLFSIFLLDCYWMS